MNSYTNLLTPNTLVNYFWLLLMGVLKTFVNDYFRKVLIPFLW